MTYLTCHQSLVLLSLWCDDLLDCHYYLSGVSSDVTVKRLVFINCNFPWFVNTNFRKVQFFLVRKYDSETRLLRTLKGNEKRYVLNKVRSIQNAISSLAGPVPRVQANDLPRKTLLRPECRSLLAFRAVKLPFRVS